MGTCLSVVAISVMAACGGGYGDGANAVPTGVPSRDIGLQEDTIGAVAAAVADTGSATEIDLRIAGAFRATRAHNGDDRSAPPPDQGNQDAGVGTVVAAPPAPAPAPAPAPSPAPAPASNTITWFRLASEGQSFPMLGTYSVRYGAGSNWVTRTLSGTVTCSNAFFGTDPAPGVVKSCEQGLPGAISTSRPTIDNARFPPRATGYSSTRVRSTWRDINTGQDCTPGPSTCGQASGNIAVPSDIGAFREPCTLSHMAYDDPIVFPGQPGASHLHTFFGNTGTTASTTAASLAGSGNSTCAGGTLNRTAYWIPAMIDTRTGTPVAPSGALFYYKTGYNGINPATVQPLPQGLRMVSGDPRNAQPFGPFRYGCVGLNNDYWAGGSIPNCAVGQDLLMEVIFPQCWDGVNLDSPDHISHMANPVGGRCPSSHPVPVPVISFEVHYTVRAGDAPSAWRLSSDAYDARLPGGWSGHGDWFNGWDTDTMGTFVRNCEQKSLDCHAYLLGDGRTLY